ncbi:pilus assembly protein TadG-related protein [Nocardiopsis sp. NPDC006198]|uniref:Pilus assembly protein TadG-related protein n=1 Tax=Streptomonospora nanhaiensis TaxID=1323731 RepID=A0ABY6YJE5_9ACTN|nr:pilus assembly protein TadG-related protein [Streptomonospora nanhaiensis]WAE72348.1 pilus assembly protein TadG-related protein [Streptomonospora nanhaiensis]
MGLRRTLLPSSSARKRPRPLLGRDDEGQANTLLLFGLTLALLALTLLFVRVGAANDTRSRVQTAADAAALAAVGALQDEAAQEMVEGGIPYPWFDEEVAEGRAEEYARANGAVLTDIRASDNSLGRYGNIVRVEVRGAVCQRELEEDGSRHWNDVVCDGSEDETDTVVGNASAIAIVRVPHDCGVDGGVMDCGGGPVTDVESAKRLVAVHLVDQEGRYRFDPDSYFGGGAVVNCSSLGSLHPAMCAVHNRLQEEFGGFYISAGGRRTEPGSDHHTGQAVDYMMVSDLGAVPTPQMHQTAVTVINWIIPRARELRVKGIIYDHHIWNAAFDPVGPWESVRRFHQDTGNNTQDHVDHIHLAAGEGNMQ